MILKEYNPTAIQRFWVYRVSSALADLLLTRTVFCLQLGPVSSHRGEISPKVVCNWSLVSRYTRGGTTTRREVSHSGGEPKPQWWAKCIIYENYDFLPVSQLSQLNDQCSRLFCVSKCAHSSQPKINCLTAIHSSQRKIFRLQRAKISTFQKTIDWLTTFWLTTFWLTTC